MKLDQQPPLRNLALPELFPTPPSKIDSRETSKHRKGGGDFTADYGISQTTSPKLRTGRVVKQTFAWGCFFVSDSRQIFFTH